MKKIKNKKNQLGSETFFLVKLFPNFENFVIIWNGIFQQINPMLN